MAYTPPAGNAVNFNFTTSGYGPPVPTGVNFNFTDTVVTNNRRRQIYGS
jgi:hypothetical protein